MKKNLIILLALVALAFSPFKASAQEDVLFPDTTSVRYLHSRYKAGDTVQLFYGSGSNKNFEFVSIDNFSTLKSGKAYSDCSKHRFVIDKVRTEAGKSYISGKADWLSDKDNYMKVVVDLEGAVDNKEIIEPNNIKPKAIAKAPVKKKHS
jgi:hypothetical protein